jgi:uncharacterized protein YndB with AHSA1/START domain
VTYDSLSLSEVIPARPERIYAAWLSSDEHTAFTGDKAVVEPFVGGKHSAFDGYAVGQTVELQPGRRIVQTWRAEDFPLGSPDSRVEVTLEETVGGTMLTILHTDIPSGQGASYRDGWVKFYLEPLKGYFVAVSGKTNGVRKQPPKPAVRLVAKARPKKANAAPKAKPTLKAKAKATAAKKKVKPTKTKARVSKPGRKAQRPSLARAGAGKRRSPKARKRRS